MTAPPRRLEGDEIPADTYVVDCWGDVAVEGCALVVWTHTPGKAYVEVPVPDFAAAVAAEQATRAGTAAAATAGEVTG